jgi:hypothetical protein
MTGYEDRRVVAAKRIAAAMKRHDLTKEDIGGRLANWPPLSNIANRRRKWTRGDANHSSRPLSFAFSWKRWSRASKGSDQNPWKKPTASPEASPVR